MAKKKCIPHEEALKLAVRLTCSYLGTSHSATTNAEELMVDYYRQIRRVEARLQAEDDAAGENDQPS